MSKIETLAGSGKDWSNGLRGEVKPKTNVKKFIQSKKMMSKYEPTAIASKKTGTIPNFHLEDGYNFCIEKEDIK